MSRFCKAWAAYSGIQVKLAPQALQGDLATALFIYTMNLDDLLEKYTWNCVKAYHFEFHWKRVIAGKSIYYPTEWQQVNSELITSRCFAHPHLPRHSWTANQNPGGPFQRRTYDLPIRERRPKHLFSQPAYTPGGFYSAAEHRSMRNSTSRPAGLLAPPAGGGIQVAT